MHPNEEDVKVTEDGQKAACGKAGKNFDIGEVDNVDLDDVILQANGHRVEMPRQFSWLSAVGFGFSITNSWIGYLVRDTTPHIW